jgi:hypothetical protein
VPDDLPRVGHQQESASDKFLFPAPHHTFASDSRAPITRSRSQPSARAAKNENVPQATAMTGAKAGGDRPRGRRAAFMLGDQLPQIFQAPLREGYRVLAIGSVDPQTAVFRFHVECEVPQ